jgi:hypothetical protein
VKDVHSQSATGLNLHQVCSNRIGGGVLFDWNSGRDVVFSRIGVGSMIADDLKGRK